MDEDAQNALRVIRRGGRQKVIDTITLLLDTLPKEDPVRTHLIQCMVNDSVGNPLRVRRYVNGESRIGARTTAESRTDPMVVRLWSFDLEGIEGALCLRQEDKLEVTPYMSIPFPRPRA